MASDAALENRLAPGGVAVGKSRRMGEKQSADSGERNPERLHLRDPLV
jgi:hypothetical protein